MEYFLDTDESSHWYLVESAYRKEWDAWTSLDQDTEDAWEVPFFAKELGSHPNRVNFQSPRQE